LLENKPMDGNYNTDIISYIRGIGDRNRRHVDCKILDQVLKTPAKNPSNIEQIAKDLAIYDPKHITLHDMLVYGQILENLRLAKISWLKEEIIDKWAEKLKSISFNPGSFEYNKEKSKEVTLQEERKTNEEQGLTTLEDRMEGLSITISHHQASQTANEYRTPESNILQEIEEDIEDTNMEVEEQEKESTDKEISVSFPTSTIEHSRWSPENRICNRDRSFKANMLTYALSDESKEERVKYVQWILGNNHHIKTIKEVFKNGNNWIEADFDCEHSRDAAMDRIKKKEGEWLKLIPEEDKDKSQKAEQQEKRNAKKEKEENIKQEKNDEETRRTKEIKKQEKEEEMKTPRREASR
jgi:hypothetical protein